MEAYPSLEAKQILYNYTVKSVTDLNNRGQHFMYLRAFVRQKLTVVLEVAEGREWP